VCILRTLPEGTPRKSRDRGWNGSGRETGKSAQYKNIEERKKQYGKKRNQAKASYVCCGFIHDGIGDLGRRSPACKGGGRGKLYGHV
jgi:hypothetical protein